MQRKVKTLMFLGTGSDVGKSVTAAAFCRILKRRGHKVAPFKAQNMSNNSYITVEGGEIGRAQVVQAEAAGLLPSVHMNPILLKPSSGLGAQVVVQGRVRGNLAARDYYEHKTELVEAVMESFQRLADEYDVIVIEGAGSCCEINLRANDLVNFGMAERVGAPCVLVADIDRGGVFAQVVGSTALMTRREKQLTKGFLINKFRGDPSLFADGIRMIEERTKKPVFGLVPYYENVHIDPEDSVAVQTDKRSIRPTRPDRINAAVLKLPGISNFTDLEALEREPDVLVNYLHRPQNLPQGLDDYDLLILPGTKNVMEDAAWISRTGWATKIREFANRGGYILGLCGGYQLLGRDVLDPLGVESDRGTVKALGLMPLTTTLAGDKILRRVVGRDLRTNKTVTGYEIHMGRTEPAGQNRSGRLEPMLTIHEPGRTRSWPDGFGLDDGRIQGTYLHGLLDSPAWRLDFLNRLRREKNLPEKRRAASARGGRFHQYDRLADHFEKYADVDRILEVMGL